MGESLKGRTSWNKGIPMSEKAKEKNRKAHLGKVPWNKGKRGIYSEEIKRKMGAKNIGRQYSAKYCKERGEETKKRWQNPEFRKRAIEARKLFGKDPKFKEKISKISKKLWENPKYRAKMVKKRKKQGKDSKYREKLSKVQKRLWEDPKHRDKTLTAQRKGMKIRPNKPEQRFLEIIEKYDLPYKYVGDGEVWIGSENPDFIETTNGKKEVIEIFGVAFHSPLFTFIGAIPHRRTYHGRIDHYKKYGFKCHIFWDRDVMSEHAEDIILSKLEMR